MKLHPLVIATMVIHHLLRSNASVLGLRDPGHGPTPTKELNIGEQEQMGYRPETTQGPKLPAESMLSSV